MNDYLKLAEELRHLTSKCLPKTQVVVKARKKSPCDSPERARARNLLWRARTRKPTAYSQKYGTVGIKRLFPAIAEALDISEANARVRYYRGQVPPQVLKSARRKTEL
jgi:hypothetical protein